VVKGKELQQELVAELKALRLAVRETAEGFILRKEGEIETLLDHLLRMPPGRLKEIARPWLREAKELKLKPLKGRMKDLKHIDALLHDLRSSVIEADEARDSLPSGKGQAVSADSDLKSTGERGDR
jgi:hypothetical protein